MPRARNLAFRLHLGPIGFVVHFVRCRIRRRPARDDIGQLCVIAEISIRTRHGKVEISTVAIDLAFAGFRQNDEFMGKITANRPRIRAHRDGLQANPRKSAQIRHEHAIVSHFRAFHNRGRTNRHPSSEIRVSA